MCSVCSLMCVFSGFSLWDRWGRGVFDGPSLGWWDVDAAQHRTYCRGKDHVVVVGGAVFVS